MIITLPPHTHHTLLSEAKCAHPTRRWGTARRGQGAGAQPNAGAQHGERKGQCSCKEAVWTRALGAGLAFLLLRLPGDRSPGKHPSKVTASEASGADLSLTDSLEPQGAVPASWPRPDQGESSQGSCRSHWVPKGAIPVLLSGSGQLAVRLFQSEQQWKITSRPTSPNYTHRNSTQNYLIDQRFDSLVFILRENKTI